MCIHPRGYWWDRGVRRSMHTVGFSRKSWVLHWEVEKALTVVFPKEMLMTERVLPRRRQWLTAALPEHITYCRTRSRQIMRWNKQDNSDWIALPESAFKLIDGRGFTSRRLAEERDWQRRKFALTVQMKVSNDCIFIVRTAASCQDRGDSARFRLSIFMVC